MDPRQLWSGVLDWHPCLELFQTAVEYTASACFLMVASVFVQIGVSEPILKELDRFKDHLFILFSCSMPQRPKPADTN